MQNLKALTLAGVLATALPLTLGAGLASGANWETVANKNDPIPGASSGRNFNSFNQPSVNASGLVVFRARSRGGPPQGEPDSGIFTRDMGHGKAAIQVLASRTEAVPYPSNITNPPDDLPTTFTEFPAIPRIAIGSAAIATRGNHRPVWEYALPDGSETRAGTSGIYASLDKGQPLLTGASKLGGVGDFPFYAVPGALQPTWFDVFPGAPAITDTNVIAFKGNYQDGTAKTGVYYRRLEQAEMGGDANYVELIANSDTAIPNPGACAAGTSFGSTAPPSAAVDWRGVERAVFVGEDNEDSPTCGGIYAATLEPAPSLATLIGLESQVPGEAAGTVFTRFGEGLSYDGRYVAFWAAWGAATRALRLYCPDEGSQERRDYCNNTGEFAGAGDVNSICGVDGESCYQQVSIPVNQGIFVLDMRKGTTRRISSTAEGFDDYLYWVYSGKVPGDEGEGGDDSEPPRWRASAFAAVAGRGAGYRVAFKARTGEISPQDNTYQDPLDGLYLARAPGNTALQTLVDTTMPGQVLDPQAPAGALITAIGLERDGFRGNWLAIGASMGEESGEEEASMAGIYVSRIP